MPYAYELVLVVYILSSTNSGSHRCLYYFSSSKRAHFRLSLSIAYSTYLCYDSYHLSTLVPIGSWSLTIFEIRPLSHPLDGRRDQSKMHIKQITISNFRSFRQQPEIHPFSPGTNAVVGRNGSGKSNLFDAVQFCLMLSSRWHTLRAVSNTIIEERSRGGPRESIG